MQFVKPLNLEDINISGLTEDETRRLNQVLDRNNKVVNHENSRLSKMSNEVKSNVTEFSKKAKSCPSEKCLSCAKGIDDSFKGCEKCQKPLCRSCCHSFSVQKIMLCKACYNEMLLEAKKARWFYDNIPKSGSASRSRSTLKKSEPSKPVVPRKAQIDAELDDNEKIEAVVESSQHCQPMEKGDEVSEELLGQIIDKMIELEFESLNSKSGSRQLPRRRPSRDTGGKDQVKAPKAVVKPKKKDPAVNVAIVSSFVGKLLQMNHELKGNTQRG